MSNSSSASHPDSLDPLTTRRSSELDDQIVISDTPDGPHGPYPHPMISYKSDLEGGAGGGGLSALPHRLSSRGSFSKVFAGLPHGMSSCSAGSRVLAPVDGGMQLSSSVSRPPLARYGSGSSSAALSRCYHGSGQYSCHDSLTSHCHPHHNSHHHPHHHMHPTRTDSTASHCAHPTLPEALHAQQPHSHSTLARATLVTSSSAALPSCSLPSASTAQWSRPLRQASTASSQHATLHLPHLAHSPTATHPSAHGTTALHATHAAPPRSASQLLASLFCGAPPHRSSVSRADAVGPADGHTHSRAGVGMLPHQGSGASDGSAQGERDAGQWGCGLRLNPEWRNTITSLLGGGRGAWVGEEALSAECARATTDGALGSSAAGVRSLE